jgi:hypothetical protein
MKTAPQFKMTDKHEEALVLINNSFANIWSHPKGARGGKKEVDNCCEYCGKYSKDGDGQYFQILTSGVIIPNRIPEDIVWELYQNGLIEDQPQGGFSIGSTCAKKLLGKELAFYIESPECDDDVERNEFGDEYVVGCARCGKDVNSTDINGLCKKCSK